MELKETKFSFKATIKRDPVTNEPVRGEDGKIVKEKAAEPITLKVPQFESIDDLALIFKDAETENGKKRIALVMDTLNQHVFMAQARSLIDEDLEALRTAGALPEDKMSFDYIANMPPSARKGAAISEETWKEFVEDYKSVIVHFGKTPEQAEMGAKLFVRKLYPVKMNKKVLAPLDKALNLWFSNSEKKEEFQQVYEYLAGKLNEYLNANEDELVAAV